MPGFFLHPSCSYTLNDLVKLPVLAESKQTGFPSYYLLIYYFKNKPSINHTKFNEYIFIHYFIYLKLYFQI
ncbi:hypothetical protein XSR1_470003 [Xenorhabdus szentirmaii DSM 16338]|uniref:Uncharacterized protein n=1 Tax=Xenorhabdus szentirmaii DSM 16338 TaxID=1427518 RepID=W1J334_9GAMM|nr:hypothetical protein XSR1_470003 [Xenorhabdus szentirmaii DSM 16338]